MARFTEGELEVMQVLWEHGELKPGEIQERFPRGIRNAALRSVLLVLLEKGHVTPGQHSGRNTAHVCNHPKLVDDRGSVRYQVPCGDRSTHGSLYLCIGRWT